MPRTEMDTPLRSVFYALRKRGANFGAVAFSTSCTTAYPVQKHPHPVTESMMNSLKKAYASFKSKLGQSGGTDLMKGLTCGVDLIKKFEKDPNKKRANPDKPWRVLVITDMTPTVGMTSLDDIIAKYKGVFSGVDAVMDYIKIDHMAKGSYENAKKVVTAMGGQIISVGRKKNDMDRIFKNFMMKDCFQVPAPKIDGAAMATLHFENGKDKVVSYLTKLPTEPQALQEALKTNEGRFEHELAGLRKAMQAWDNQLKKMNFDLPPAYREYWINGFASAVGDKASNLKLSKRRSMNVMCMLTWIARFISGWDSPFFNADKNHAMVGKFNTGRKLNLVFHIGYAGESEATGQTPAEKAADRKVMVHISKGSADEAKFQSLVTITHGPHVPKSFGDEKVEHKNLIAQCSNMSKWATPGLIEYFKKRMDMITNAGVQIPNQ
eukprot:TRINITY_DN66186_c6_g1_i1.p1 TRINITY_DN66186_c6_g1~~TRINITY_DN66186_c6_g1_i1.p1  ORF type:complete len:508 (+),score=280.07 TRINITY_DN66186_c6_g1_i1:219-1526(+)